MARKYFIDKEKGVSYDLWEGVITLDECFNNVISIFADKDWPPHKYIHLADLRNITVDLILNETMNTTIEEFCTEHAEILKNLKVAILGYDVFTKGMALKDIIAQFPLKMVVFNSPDIACEWLGIDTMEAQRRLGELRVQLRKGN